jgi:superfamily II DNA helicase RecQ
MEKARAIQVLSVLAQGMDPDSERTLPDYGPYNALETIRALHVAISNLIPFVTEGRRIPDNYGAAALEAAEREQMEEARRKSHQAWVEEFPEMDDKQLQLFEALKQWRNKQAKEENVPGYLVFSNATLSRVAHDYPDTMDALAKIKGIGEVKLARYSDALLDIVTEYMDLDDQE